MERGVRTAGPALIGLLLAVAACAREPAGPEVPGAGRPDLAGSASCRECHEPFYRKWEGSRHGRAMQVVTREFVATLLSPPVEPITVRGVRLDVDLGVFPPVLRAEEPGGERRYPLAHALGGKNVLYFLTPLPRGRLQVLPLAFDIDGRRWFDATASMVRHAAETPVDWRDPMLTFNTSCHGCHVSQLQTNYDPAADAYHTTWAEPGISCETCHNGAAEHVRRYREAAKTGAAPADPALLVYKGLDPERSTATCAPCHAKASPLGTTWRAGEDFFDHFTLVTLEDPDFFPDGRDLGENYTMTGWLLSPCVAAGQVQCIHCHTSSGRYRFAEGDPNQACASCHAERVADAVAHHRHAPGTPGSRCIDCHMPKTSFARMVRSDHSLRPPMPAATVRFGSPNACNLCHADKDAAWADGVVRGWHAGDYQAETLRWAGWIEAARKQEFPDLPAILACLAEPGRAPPVVASSLARLLAACREPAVDGALAALLGHAEPLVRSAAAGAIAARANPAETGVLLAALGDVARAVRFRAVAGLGGLSPADLAPSDRALFGVVAAEYVESLRGRPDQWDAWYNLGNWHLAGDRAGEAAEAYERAIVLRPDAELPLVNSALAHARLGDLEAAEARLRRALTAHPGSAPARFNLGLLLAERGDAAGAEREFREALKADPHLDVAAVNLGVLLWTKDPEEAIAWCRKALDLRPADPRHAFTLAFYLAERGNTREAMEILEEVVRRKPADADVYALLGALRERAGDAEGAAETYRQGAENPRLPDEIRRQFEERRRLAGR